MIRLLLCLLWMCALWTASVAGAAEPTVPWSDLPQTPETARAEVRREILPELRRRQESAEARHLDASEAFEGAASIEAAFPVLGDTELGQAAVLHARLHALDRAGVEREILRRAPIPDVGRPWTSRLEAAWRDTLEAEDRADADERRFLYALLGVLDRHPELSAEAVSAARRPLDDARAAATRDADPTDADSLATLEVLEEAHRRWLRITRALWLHAVVDAAPVPDPDPELEALDRGEVDLLADDARRRLALLRPWLDEQTGEQADQVEIAWLTDVLTPLRVAELEQVQQALDAAADALVDESTEVLEAEVQAAQRDLDLADRRYAALPSDGALASAAQEAAWAAVEVARARLELARLRVEGANSAITQAQRKAEEARQATEKLARSEDPDHDDTRWKAMAAQSEAWTAAVQAQLQPWLAAQDELDASRTATLDAAEQRAEALLATAANARTELEEGRDADAVSRDLADIVATLRRRLRTGPPTFGLDADALDVVPTLDPRDQRLAAIGEARSAARAMPVGEARDTRLDLLETVENTIEREDEPIERARTRAASKPLTWRDDLVRATKLRRRLEPLISPHVVDEDWRRAWNSLDEIPGFLVAQGKVLLRDRTLLVSEELPRLSAWSSIRVLIADAFWFIIALGVWGWGRRRAESLAGQLLDLTGWAGHLRPIPRTATIRAISDALTPAIDAAVAWFLYSEAQRLLPELGVLVGLFAYTAMMRALAATLDVFVARADQKRPAFITISEASATQWRRTWAIVSTWLVGGWLLQRILEDLLLLDVIADVVWYAWAVLGLLLALVVLARWETRLEGRVRRGSGTPAWMERWLARSPGSVLAPVRAAIFASYLLGWAAWDIAQGRAATGGGYATLATVMDRWRFVGEDNKEKTVTGRPIEEELREEMLGTDVPEEVQLKREEAEKRLAAAFAAWSTEHRRGTIVLTGDRGDGKGLFMRRMAAMLLTNGETPPHESRLQRRLRSTDDALHWFAKLFGMSTVPSDVDELCSHVCTLEPEVHVVRDMQRSFLRTVGGFDALRTFLYVCNATSETHFWVLVFHRPAWAYLSRLGGHLFNAGVVREVIDLSPLDGPMVRELITKRTEHVGLEVDFRRLENTGPFGARPEVEHERAVASFFRLLAEVSGGNPLVALHLWTRSLRRRPDGTADVTVIPELGSPTVEHLDNQDLFVLTALRTQERLTLDELIEVLNMPGEEVRSTVRELEHRGLVHRSERGFRIDDPQLRAVTRSLRRRHFIQWAV